MKGDLAATMGFLQLRCVVPDVQQRRAKWQTSECRVNTKHKQTMCFVCRSNTFQLSTIRSDVNYLNYILNGDLPVSMNWCWTTSSQGAWLLSCLKDKHFEVSNHKPVAAPLPRLCLEQGSGSQVQGHDEWLQSHPTARIRMSKPCGSLELPGDTIPGCGTAWIATLVLWQVLSKDHMILSLFT